EPAPAEPGDDVPGDASFREVNPWDVMWDAAVTAAKIHNDEVIDNSTPDNWLPKYVYQDVAGGGNVTQGLLHDCDEVMYPGSYSGLGILSVMTLDLSTKLTLGDAIGLMSEGETVYSSRENLYVATTPWTAQIQQEPGVTSYVHKFDVGDPNKTEYRASGQVPGYLMNQWSMSEHNGDLRVASTDYTENWDEESQVNVLREDDDNNLETIGQVGGLGKGERIYAVRFIGETGYVVTFRQIDPLYTIDASDPTAPAVVGELKIPGYSAYLHPVGEGLLLGVGREGNEEGQVFGTQLSLFDVSDASNPVQLHTAAVTTGDGGGSSEVEWDHKAFLYWEPTSMAMLPVSWWSYDDINGESYFSGAIGYNVDVEAGITEIAQVEHPLPEGEEGWYWSNQLRRSLVVDDAVYTVSNLGIKASDLGNLGDLVWLEF
ncbi:MAG: beta-propeller domain-containing protein, partial [Myxococcales bacterium]|nr:beta-propeller domain-containing protein [Myxococcales bacterium]